MINLIQSPSTSHAYSNYSHMVMVMELMVDGDDGGGDGGEDGLRIPPPEEKSWIDLSPK